MTDGILLAEIQRDRHLRAYEVLIIDEAHERSLNIDFLLGYLRQLLPERPDLKVIVTSATIDTARFAAHFGGAPVVEVSGRSYPVEVRYRPFGEDEGDDRDQTQAIVDAVQELVREGPGDLLVFLSGEREIRDTAEALARLDLPGVELLPLYARLSAAEQHRVFAPHPGRRIVLATNVAETSLTVPGHRRRRSIPARPASPATTGAPRCSASRSRRSRRRRPPSGPAAAAGWRPGTCIRLYSEEDFDARPGVHRAGDPAHEPGLGHPADGRARPRRHRGLPVRRAARRPQHQGRHPPPRGARRARPGPAGADEVRLTKLGRRLARIPADPRLARMVIEADRHGVVGEVLVLAAALSIQDPRERPTGEEEAAAAHHRRFADPDSDFIAYLNLWRYLREQQKALGSSAFRRLCRSEHLHHLRIREWQDVHSQLRQVALGIGLEGRRRSADEPDRRRHPPGAARRAPLARRDARPRRQRVPRRPRGAVRARARAPRSGAGARSG